MTTDAREISQAELDSLFAVRDSLDAENKALREFASGIWGKQATASLLLRIPESGDPDLDAMIRKAQRRDLAGKAMQGMIESGWDSGDVRGYEGWRDEMSREAVRYADALLAALDATNGKEG